MHSPDPAHPCPPPRNTRNTRATCLLGPYTLCICGWEITSAISQMGSRAQTRRPSGSARVLATAPPGQRVACATRDSRLSGTYINAPRRVVCLLLCIESTAPGLCSSIGSLQRQKNLTRKLWPTPLSARAPSTRCSSCHSSPRRKMKRQIGFWTSWRASSRYVVYLNFYYLVLIVDMVCGRCYLDHPHPHCCAGRRRQSHWCPSSSNASTSPKNHPSRSETLWR